jgi:hypothetical protein
MPCGAATAVLVFDACLALVCVLKGKYRSGLFGLFLPPVGFIGAVRLARPNSIWARRRYHGKRLERATRRAADFDRRWKPVQADWEDFGGRPSQPNPPPTPAGGRQQRRWWAAVTLLRVTRLGCARLSPGIS